jgi:hypothetical protein
MRGSEIIRRANGGGGKEDVEGKGEEHAYFYKGWGGSAMSHLCGTRTLACGDVNNAAPV